MATITDKGIGEKEVEKAKDFIFTTSSREEEGRLKLYGWKFEIFMKGEVKDNFMVNEVTMSFLPKIAENSNKVPLNQVEDHFCP